MANNGNHDPAAALAACRAYLKDAQDHLGGIRKELPDPANVISSSPSLSCLKAKERDEALELRAPTVAAEVYDREGAHDRYFDPWYFVAMRLMELPGGRFLSNRSKVVKGEKERFYVHYFGPKTKEGNLPVARTIANTPPSADTRHDPQRGPNSYRDYRRVSLKWKAKAEVRKMGQKARNHSSARLAAIKFAVQLFRRQLGKKRKLPGLGMSAPEYERLLRYALETADAIHRKLHGT